MSAQIAGLPLGWWLYAVVLLVLGAAGCWAFVIRYWITFKWWKSEFGRHLIAMSSCLGAFFTYYLLLVFWPDIPGRGLIRMALFTLLVAVIVWRLVVFERVEMAKKRERRRR